MVLIGISVLTVIPLLKLGIYDHPSADDFNYSIQTYRVWQETHSLGKVIGAAWSTSIRFWHTWQGLYAVSYTHLDVYKRQLFPAISATKWSAFLVNAVALVAVLLLLYGIAGYFTADTKRQLLVCLLFGCSVGCLDLSTYLRAYMPVSYTHLAQPLSAASGIEVI